MSTPFHDDYNDIEDKKLAEKSLNGDKKALEALVIRHQSYIYNIAWKMCGNADDALDITQEVLIKAITNLSKFKFKSAFQTWLYRITFNHFLNMKKNQIEERIVSFEEYGNTLDFIPNKELTALEQIELDDAIKEGQYKCMSAMLLCLTRDQRITYVLGDIFGADHKVAAELLNLEPPNYRMRLSRARKDLYNFMNNKCGLVNKENPCRCRKKVSFSIENNFINPSNLEYNLKHEPSIKTIISERADAFGEYYNETYAELQCELPYKKNLKLSIFKNIIDNKMVISALNLN